MKVLKFGGSSVASSKNIQKVLAIVSKSSEEQDIVVVVSAFGKTTNALIKGATLAAQKWRLFRSSKRIRKQSF